MFPKPRNFVIQLSIEQSPFFLVVFPIQLYTEKESLLYLFCLHPNIYYRT